MTIAYGYFSQVGKLNDSICKMDYVINKAAITRRKLNTVVSGIKVGF